MRDKSQHWKSYEERNKARAALKKIGIQATKNILDPLIPLVGASSIEDLQKNYDKYRHLVLGLGGPHGYTIYKMLEAQQR